MSQLNQGQTSPGTSYMSTDNILPSTPGSVKSLRTEERKSKGLSTLLPKLPSSDSLTNSPGGLNDYLDHSSADKDRLQTPDYTSKLTRKESYKAQRKNYRKEKKRVTNELLNSLKDPSGVVIADWLKIRGTLKSWTKLWCVLKPGVLVLYKTQKAKSSHWVGTILLSSCKVIERPSKKDGFCFKLYNPLDQSIWAPRGPENETIGAVVQPLPSSYSIFRASSQASGMCWLDALEISIKNNTALVRSVSNKSGSANHETQWNEADYEKHFVNDLDDVSQPENGAHSNVVDCEMTDSESDVSAKEEDNNDVVPPESPYAPVPEEEFGGTGGELADENKSLISHLAKQVRPGMDLSKVVLPTFILEPRSFLDKLSDSYYHVDLLSSAVLEDDAFTRMKSIVRWYLSGLYKKPKGLKKPYNPILGEIFRCYWLNPNGSKTFYIAEQVSHHPPVSAFYVSNRQDGYSISASILARSKVYVNSTSAILDGTAILTLLPRGEDYALTIPYAHCKGILVGTLSMELGGKVTIDCEKTGYHTEIEFKLKPLFSGADQTNLIFGKLKLGNETLATLEGYWDTVINYKDKRTGEESVFWHSTEKIRKNRLMRHTVPIDLQDSFESQRLWQFVSEAIHNDDMNAATKEKTILEEAQRARSKERKLKGEDWVPSLFQQDMKTGRWIYKHADLRPWDPRNDMYQYEYNYVISTRTKHPTPMIRTSSIISVDPKKGDPRTLGAKTPKRKIAQKQVSSDADVNDSATTSEEFHSDSTRSTKNIPKTPSNAGVLRAIQELEQRLKDHGENIMKLQISVNKVLENCRSRRGPTYVEMFLIMFVAGCLQALLLYWA